MPRDTLCPEFYRKSWKKHNLYQSLTSSSQHINVMNLLWGFTFAEAIDKETDAPIKIDVNDLIKVCETLSAEFPVLTGDCLCIGCPRGS